MRGLYGRNYGRRLAALAADVGEDSVVVDLCAGLGDFYDHLRAKRIIYKAFDASEESVAYGQKKGLDIRLADVNKLNFPPADYYVMIDSLYHFYDQAEMLIERMVSASRRRVLIMEPIKNLTSSNSRPLAWLARRLTNEGGGRNGQRFTETTLDRLMFGALKHRLLEAKKAPGGRDKIYILGKK
jgi:hypothetical protein